jgi:Family of unknown function (DUF5706)
MSQDEDQRTGPDIDIRRGVRDGQDLETGLSATASAPFSDVQGRRSVDVLLQVMTQDLVILSGQADLKASIMITAASIVVSLSLNATRYKEVRWSVATLSLFAVVALANAILAVLPRGRPTRVGAGHPATPYNALYFAHASEIPVDDYVREIAGVCREDASLYEALTRQVHALSVHLERRKFAHLRRAYAWFLSGFIAAGFAQLITLTVR